MTKWIVDIKGEIEGDYEIIGKYEERPQGKWIKENKLFGGFGDGILVNTCSECLESYIYHGFDANFCPECGADMREADND